jgi:hypothetical protein
MKSMRYAVAAAIIVSGLAASIASAATASSPLLVQPGEMPGFASAKVQHFSAKTAARYVHSVLEEKPSPRARRKVERLNAEGFREGVVELLSVSHSGAEALSEALVLGSAEFAKRQQREKFTMVSRELHKHGRVIRFTAPGIPGSIGVALVVRGKAGGAANLFFTSGSCLFIVGDALGHGKVTQLKAPVIDGAEAVYRRSQAACASGSS